MSARERNSQGQPVGQHRAQVTPVPAPIRIGEISAVVEEEGFAYEEQDQQEPSLPQQPLAADVRVNSDTVAEVAPAQLPAERRTTLNSIRAPFAPGQNHLHPANQLRGSSALPAGGVPRQPGASSDWREAGTRQTNDDGADVWQSHPEGTRGRVLDTTVRVDTSVVWSHEQQSAYESVAVPEGRDVRGDIGPLIDSLHGIFERDREIASQSDVSRCGICYLHFNLRELHYREEEGFYICASCAQALTHNRIVMLRRQQHL